jgi:class 3 adenylate cyclase/KaiC/GvpD/RAD55 family RecA-like ATPase
LVSTGISSLDSILSGDGYPDRTAILVVGAPGVGKEALNYWFVYSGLAQGDFCQHVSRLPVREIMRDAKAFGVDYGKKIPFFVASAGGQLQYDHRDLRSLSIRIQEVLDQNKDRRIRLVFDAISSLLMQYPVEVVYNFLSRFLSDLKSQYDIVILATIEEGMHSAQVTTAMQQLFDGVLEFKFLEDGLRLIPLLRVRKMLGMAPHPGFFGFTFSRNGMEFSRVEQKVKGGGVMEVVQSVATADTAEQSLKNGKRSEGWPTTERRLAAIMFTDIVGYTSMSQKNERFALDLLDEQRKLIRPIFSKHNGREIEAIGDAFLVEFASALEAVTCAREIQISLHELNLQRPMERSILLRIGIHLGDIVHMDNNVYGDSVNVASRIEPLSEPGGVCITSSVFGHVRNNPEFLFESMGKKELKNVQLPIEVYRIVLPWEERVEGR